MAQLFYPPLQPFYNGSHQTATSGKTFHTIDPSNAQRLALVHESSHADIDSAIDCASNAFLAWSQTPPALRARILLKAVEILRSRNDTLAQIETHDTGKPFSETSTVDVLTGADVLEYFANLVASGGLNGETTQLRDEAWIYTTKAPLGVCVGIGAWNYPLQIALWKSAPCLAAGNTMVYKPSEITPLHATRLAEIYIEAGVPPGVFNVVHGDGPAVGQYLVAHPRVAKVSFTGQVSTGRAVASAAAQDMKYVTVELGGKSPLLILPDADLEMAVDGAMMANFFSSGQVCTNGTRVFVPDTMKTAFEKRLLAKMHLIRMGNPRDVDTNFGPLVSNIHLRKVLAYIEHGKNVDKAKVLYNGISAHQNTSKLINGELGKGFWCPPIIFTDCTDNMKIAREEVFGPVMCILPYSTQNKSSNSSTSGLPSYIYDLLVRANDTPLGLAAGVFTSDLNLAHRVIAGLEAGITWVNTWGESPAEMSVGGWKMSGMGVENGRKGIEAWVRNKSTLVEMGGKVATSFEEVTHEGSASNAGSSKL